MKYPTSGGRPWDAQRKREFRNWFCQFQDQIKIDSEAVGAKLTKKQLDCFAHNCAFHVVTAPR